jgi:putative Holliday junction resolvase
METKMRLLALDVGEKRIGMAMSDPLGITAQRAGAINRRSIDETLAGLRDFTVRHGIGTVIVGLPLSMDGSKGKSAASVEGFADKLRRALTVPVVLWDERLTTAEGERLMRSAGISRKKRTGRLDEVAAQLILQSYLDSHTGKSQTCHTAGESQTCPPEAGPKSQN